MLRCYHFWTVVTVRRKLACRYRLIAVLLAACTDTSRIAPVEGTQAAPGADATAPLYVVHTRVNAAEDVQLSYLASVSSIEAGAELDLDGAIELEAPDVGIVGLPGTPYVYAGSCADPTITRWEVGADGTFHEGPRLSF